MSRRSSDIEGERRHACRQRHYWKGALRGTIYSGGCDRCREIGIEVCEMNQKCEWFTRQGCHVYRPRKEKLHTPSGVRCGLHNNESSLCRIARHGTPDGVRSFYSFAAL